jgi:hypothetical protein
MVTAMVDGDGDPNGFYCFNVPFDFDVAVATPVFAFVIGEDDIEHALEFAASVSYPGGNPIPQCPPDVDVLVEITDLDGDANDIPFSIVFV